MFTVPVVARLVVLATAMVVVLAGIVFRTTVLEPEAIVVLM
jgi:hypothetical protein